MKKSKIGEFLYLFYRKRTASFLANIYKASITGYFNDIHRARLDVKKIVAFYEFFDLLFPGAVKDRVHRKLFEPLFSYAGKIREIQVHYIHLEDPELKEHLPASFRSWLEEKEQYATRKFLKTIKKFDDERLANAERVVKRVCYSEAFGTCGTKTRKFIQQKVKKIETLLSGELDDTVLHKVRKQLKTISTVGTLVSSMQPDSWLERLIATVTATEVMIGEWHDRVVLLHDIERFTATVKGISESDLTRMNLLREAVLVQKNGYTRQFLPEVGQVVTSVTTGFSVVS